MTTPNIKALAEKVIRDSENPFSTRIARGYGPMFTEREMKLAFALLRVMEDAERLYECFEGTVDAIDLVKGFGHILVMEEDRQALESHNKLMEELGSEN